MSRKIQIAKNVFIILIVLAMYMFTMMWAGGFLSKEALFEHWERANHYGPAEKILLNYETPDGRAVIFAKYKDNFYFRSCEKKGLLWREARGPNGIITVDSDGAKKGSGFYSNFINAVYGMTSVEETNEIFFYMDADFIENKPLVDVVEVGEDGFFFKKYDDERLTYTDTIAGTDIPYLEGRDAEGNVMWESGELINNINDQGVFRAIYPDYEDEEKNNLPELRFRKGIESEINLNYNDISTYEDVTGTCRFEEGHIVYENHRFKIMYLNGLRYEGTDNGDPNLEGVKPGTVFVLER